MQTKPAGKLRLRTSKHTSAWYIINGITLYRIITAPLLLALLFTGRYEIFKWLLLLSFFTDFIDGFLARKYKVASISGTKLDSIGDDLTVLVAMAGLLHLHPGFIRDQMPVLLLLLGLFLVQVIAAFYRYGKMTSFHTYLAKAAAVLQGIFMLITFFSGKPYLGLFYAAAIITLLELLEEILLVYRLPQWETNVRGIFWVSQRKKRGPAGNDPAY